MANLRDYLQLHFIVFLWGFTAVLGKLVSLPATEMVFYRTLLAAAGLGVLMVVLKKSFRVAPWDVAKLLAVGGIVGAHWLTFFISGRVANPSTSLVGFATCSLWAALLEPLSKRQPFRLLDVAFGLVVLLGLGVIVSYNFQYLGGLLLGILSGLTAAIFSILNARLVSRVNAYTMTFYQMVGASALIALSFPVYLALWSESGTLQLQATLADWFYIAVLAWVCSVYAFATAINLTKKLSVFFIQLTLNLEPVYGVLLALWIFGAREVMGVQFYLGTAIILLAVAVYPVIKRKLYPDSARV
jgi:drug/metabolite transporter (DMT)-like permease